MLELLKIVNELIWSGPLLILLLGTHIILTLRSGFVQKKIIEGVKLSFKADNSFAILATTLAATLGTGNIIGVSTAIALGGPGALFWCWITGILGMATTYYECYYGTYYRTENGGGPMYIMNNKLHIPRVAYFYAFVMLLVCLGTGCLTQSNAVADSFDKTFGISPLITGFIVALPAGMVIIGGKQSITNVCTRVVPALCGLFLICCLYLLIINAAYIPASIVLVVKSAFNIHSVAGGIAGGGILVAARYGIARGLFTNEAGLGSAAVFAGSSNDTARNQGLISMTATFWDTVVICAITGIVIISSYLANPAMIEGYSAGGYVNAAFAAIPYIGQPLLAISIFGFAIATIIGWFFIGEQASMFVFGDIYEQVIPIIRIIYIVMVYLGTVAALETIWEIADLFNIFLIIPNVLMLLWLTKQPLSRGR